MVHVRCPECGTESEVTPQYGDEVIAVYCLRHRGGADQHVRPVYMPRITSGAIALDVEPIAA